MSIEVEELTASVPPAEAITGWGALAPGAGAATIAGDRSVVKGCSVTGGVGPGVDATAAVAERVSNRSGSSAFIFTICLELSDALKLSSDASTGFGLVLSLGRPATIAPRTRTIGTLARTNHRIFGIRGESPGIGNGTVSRTS